MIPLETARNAKKKGAKKRDHDDARYQKVFDARKQPIRGLWQRNGTFYARLSITDSTNGQKQTRRVPLPEALTVTQAQAALRKLLTNREDNALPVLRQAPKFADYVEEYVAYYKTVKDAKRPSTLNKERQSLRLWCAHMGQTRLHQINRAMINAFIAKRQGAGLSGRTVNLDVIMLRNVLKRAIDDNWIKALPTANLRPLKWTSKKRSLVTADEINRLCEVALTATKNGQQFADYIKLMAYGGARRNETLRLTWDDVDWERKQLTIGADGLSKNRENRVVDFNPNLAAHLKEMHQRRAPDSRYLFPSPQRGPRDIPAKSFLSSLDLVREASDLKINFHDCRHFFISMAVMSGIDYMTIARWVGHKDGGILIGKVYGHLSNEHAQRQAQKLVFNSSLVISEETANEA